MRMMKITSPVLEVEMDAERQVPALPGLGEALCPLPDSKH